MLRWETTHAEFQDILGPSKQMKYVAFSKLNGTYVQIKLFADFFFKPHFLEWQRIYILNMTAYLTMISDLYHVESE